MTAIILSGATGSLGGHLAAALLEQPHRIYCLVRATDAATADRRLRTRMAEVGSDDPARLVAIPANLESPRLGLTPQVWNELADQVTQIFHCAASVHLTAAYAQLAPANVGGTKELIGLATAVAERSGLPVGFHYVSTLAVFLEAVGAGLAAVDEATRPSMETAGELGYPRSKVAAERVVTRARDSGVVSTIYRPGLVTGHSLTGDTSSSDLLMPVLRAMIAIGCAPDRAEAVPGEAVDLVARHTARLSVGQPGGLAYHLVKPRPVSLMHAFDALRRAGYQLAEVSPGKWWELAEQRRDDPEVAPLMHMGPIGLRMLGLEPGYTLPSFRSDHTYDVLRRSSPEPDALDEEFFDRLVARGLTRFAPLPPARPRVLA
ncbi:SDR family oxidoreductase [Frankia sp. AgB32]|uniref:SDR family oxidoreductase n=1 Tax=Frankia sp. AgB32 TaxID=631119 RepID=UPI00200E474A|nr:SDR family oxidoreductase [Frankia sp. AgB32]MCK9893434.1 SDR family oxidoreductase [Frankia sp. AgB32]